MRYLIIVFLALVIAACDTNNQPSLIPEPNPIPEPAPDPAPEPQPNPEPEPPLEPEPDDPNGTIDETFGNQGKVVYDAGAFDTANDMAILQDGTMVVVGNSHEEPLEVSDKNISLAVFFNPDGTFKQEVRFPDVSANALAVQANGDVVIAGVGHKPGDTANVIWLRRLKPDGTLDEDFGDVGSEGVVYTGQLGSIAEVALDSKRRIIVASSIQDTVGSNSFQLQRFNPDGTADKTFGTDGVVISRIKGNSSRPTDLVIDAEDKILVVGSISEGGFAAVRYDETGKLDTFGPSGQGFSTFDFSPEHGESFAAAIALDGQGRIVMAGLAGFPFCPPRTLALVRLDKDGFPDKTFGNLGGTVLDADLSCNGSNQLGLALDEKGRILVAGTSSQEALTSLRFDANGQLDRSYGLNGAVTVPFENDFVGPDAVAAALESGGGFVVAGTNISNERDFILTRIR